MQSRAKPCSRSWAIVDLLYDFIRFNWLKLFSADATVTGKVQNIRRLMQTLGNKDSRRTSCSLFSNCKGDICTSPRLACLIFFNNIISSTFLWIRHSCTLRRNLWQPKSSLHPTTTGIYTCWPCRISQVALTGFPDTGLCRNSIYRQKPFESIIFSLRIFFELCTSTWNMKRI